LSYFSLSKNNKVAVGAMYSILKNW
jgi:hypothetical protein